MLQMSKIGIALLQAFESLKLVAYYDQVKVLTIGYGTTNSVLPANCKIVPGQCITEAKALEYLRLSLTNIFEPGVRNLLKVNVTQNQFDALVDFAYNLGVAALAGSTLLKKLNAGDFAGAQKEFLKWNRAGGVPVRGLTRRRLDEAALFGPLTRKDLIAQCLSGVDPDIKPK